MIPTYVTEGNYDTGSGAQQRNRLATFNANLDNPAVTGLLISARWDGGESLTRTLAAIGDKPFVLSMQPMPVPAGVPMVMLHGQQCGCFWTPEYLAAWKSYVDDMLAEMDAYAGQFRGLRVCFVAPYAGDNEDGVFAADPSGGGASYAEVLAAAGYTPSGAIAAHKAGFEYLATALVGLDLIPVITFAPLTPGNQPRVSDAGQVVTTGGDFAVPNAILDALVAAFSSFQCAICYDVFTGGDLPPFWQAAANTLGGLVIQMHGTDKGAFTASTFSTAYDAAVALDPLWVEAHADQVGWLGGVGAVS